MLPHRQSKTYAWWRGLVGMENGQMKGEVTNKKVIAGKLG